jgi:hypothetical protein
MTSSGGFTLRKVFYTVPSRLMGRPSSARGRGLRILHRPGDHDQPDDPRQVQDEGQHDCVSVREKPWEPTTQLCTR